MISKEDILFPHSEIRNVQDELIKEVLTSIENKQHLIAHAPTGLGKTAASVPIALSYALKNNKTVFFLTSRHTQHKIVIDTLKQIKKEYNISLIATDIIGKKWMCIQPGIEILYSGEFADYCKKLKEDNKCDFYKNTKKNNKLTNKAQEVYEELKKSSPSHTEELIRICEQEKICPYELAALLTKESKVIVADYNHVFDPAIKDSFFLRAGKEIEDSIIIVDEAHNLPKRARENLTIRLTNVILKRAIKEAAKYGFYEDRDKVEHIFNILEEMSDGLDDRNQEKLVTKDDFINRIKRAYDYDELITSLAFAGEEIRGKQKKSNMATVAFFLEFWPEEAEGFARIISKRYGAKELITELSNRCLDPSHITKDVINNCHNLILMSGTLTPTFMYKDILGFDDAKEVEFKNPFPEKNRLSLIIPETSTKYARRNKDEYQKIAAKIEEITDNIPGNVIVFFPSYFLRNNVYAFMDKNKKRILLEKSGMTKEEKNDMLDQFKGHKDDGAILMAATAGSFGEGVDLPGDYLKGVIIVGLPLEKPTLEIKELISYYDRKFSRGWEYGYVYPAIIKVLQNAGRCIRSENDKGVIVFLDERYSWDSYYKCFPLDYNVKISKLYEKKIKEFFT